MGNQQILLLIVGTVIVTLAVTAGILYVRESYTESVGDQIQQVILREATDAKIHYEKPKTLGGGSGSFEGFALPQDLKNVSGVSYQCTLGGAEVVVITAKTQDGSLHAGLRHSNGVFTIRWIGTGTLKRYSTNEMTF